MSKIPTAEKVVIAGVLKEKSFKSEQERFEAYCKAMSISVQAGEPGVNGIGKAGPAGPAGESVTQAKYSIDVTSGESSVDCGVNVENAAVNLVNNTETPTIGILAVSGSTVHLTAAAPTGNYKIKITL